MPKKNIADDGWISTRRDDQAEVRLRVRFDDQGRPVVTDVLISAPEVTAETLRSVQPARILAALLAQDHDPATNRTLANLLLMGEPEPDDNLTLGALRQRKPIPHPSSKREPLQRPNGSDSDEFYRRVATTYRSAAVESNRPVIVLADEARVPAETIRRWVKEARRRGFLGAGRKGRAG